jgi:hypothetical protein
MEELLKMGLKKAPIPTLATGLLYFVITIVLEQKNELWQSGIGLTLVLVLTFTFSLVLLIKFGKDNIESSTAKEEIHVEKQNISDVETNSGDFILGKKTNSDEPSSINIKLNENTIKKVNTGGGDFVLGEVNVKEKSNGAE